MKRKQAILTGIFAIGLPLLVAGLARAATITFFTDESTFLAASSTTLIDAEGIVSNTALTSADPLVIDGVTFDATNTGASTFVCGKLACNNSPYDSALIVTSGGPLGSPLEIDLSGAGSGFTAAGGIFGDIIGDKTAAVLRLFGVGNVLLDTRAVDVRFMGEGLPHSFFGWTASGGEITSI